MKKLLSLLPVLFLTSCVVTHPYGYGYGYPVYVSYGTYGIRAINLTTGQVSTIVPTPDTRTVGANLVDGSFTTIGTMVEDSKGDLIVCDGSWLYKIAFNQ